MLIWPFEPYKIEGGENKFGAQRSYGLHSGIDINGPLGGNTDCRTPLKAIWDCEIIHVSDSQSGYGLIIVFEIKGPWGVRWIRFCHCDAIMQAFGKHKQGTTLSLMGTTGNSTACHLHWDVFKKKPTNWSTMYAKNQGLLDEYFENPVLFMEKWKDSETDPMPKFAHKLTDFTSEEEEYKLKRINDGVNLDDEGEVDAVVGVLKDFPILKRDKENTDQENKDFKGFINRTANKFQLPVPIDDGGNERDFEVKDIEKEVGKLLVKEDQQEELLSLWKKVAGSREDYQLQLEVIKNFIKDYETNPSKDELLKQRKVRIDELEAENKALRKKKPGRVFRFWRWLLWFVKVEKD